MIHRAELDAWLAPEALTEVEAIDAPCLGGPLDGAKIPVLSPRMVAGEESLTSVWVGQDTESGALRVLPTRSLVPPVVADLRLVGSYEYHETRRVLDWLPFVEAPCRS